MPSRFETTFQQRVIAAAERAFGVTVTLSRGVLTSLSFTARRNDVRHSSLGGEYGIEIKVLMRDFILPVGSLVLDGDTIEPRTGDRITEGEEIFVIQPPDESSPSVELQAGGFEYLVHTKRVE